MLFDFAHISARERYKLLVSTIVPRPIAWIVSQDLEGKLNAAPFSFFNALSGDPPCWELELAVTIAGGRRIRGAISARLASLS